LTTEVASTEVASRVMIFLSEDDRVARRSLCDTLLDRAREDGMAGATVWRAIEGFGASGHLRTSRFPDAEHGLPLVMELVDRPERIDAFLPVVMSLAPGSLVTRETVTVARRASRPPSLALDDPPPQGSHQG